MPYRKKTKKTQQAPERFHLPEEEVAREGKSGRTGLADDMRNLCQDIADSFDARVAMLNGIQDDLGQRAAAVKRSLANAEASRMGDFRGMHQGIRARQEDRNREVASTLGGVRRELETAADHWRSMLATKANKRASRAG